MSTTWPDVLSWIRSTIENIDPVISPERRFKRTDGFLPLVEEPLQNFDRRFALEGGTGTSGETWGGTTFRETTKQVSLLIGYDAGLDIATLEDRIGRDEEQIVNAMLLKAGNPAGVTLVEQLPSQVDRTPNPFEPEKVIVEIPFEISYHLNFTP
jgi:hypothetical protein